MHRLSVFLFNILVSFSLIFVPELSDLIIQCADSVLSQSVLSTSRKFYVGEKKKGLFQHSSFLEGAAAISSGRVVAGNGILKAIWPFSGHYRPTEESFKEFCSFLEHHRVDLTNVEKSSIDDDIPPKVSTNNKLNLYSSADQPVEEKAEAEAVFEFGNKQLSQKWSTGAGLRISCVRDYPRQLQFLNLSPRINPPPLTRNSSTCQIPFKNSSLPYTSMHGT